MAGADSSIYSLIRPPTPGPGPLEQYGQAMQLKNLMGQGNMQDLQRQELETGISEKRSMREAFGRLKPGQDPREILPDLYRASPQGAMQFEKQLTDRQKADADLMKVDRENFISFMDEARKGLATVRTQEQWQQFRDEQVQRAGMFSTKPIRDLAMRGAMNFPAQYDPNFIRDSLVKAEELFTPKMTERTDGQRKWMEDTNPFTNPAIRGGSATQMRADPNAMLTDERTRSEGAANRGVTLRGQNLTDARSRETLQRGDTQYDADRGLIVSKRTGEARPVMAGEQPIGPSATNIKHGEELKGMESSRQGAIQSYNTAIATLDRLTSHPGFTQTVGAAVLPGQRFIPGTEAANFDAELEAFKAQTFLPMVQQLKGMGALSDAEGKKLAAAVGALDRSMSEKAFKESATRITNDLTAAKTKFEAQGPVPQATRLSAPKGGIKFIGFEQ